MKAANIQWFSITTDGSINLSNLVFRISSWTRRGVLYNWGISCLNSN